MVSSGPPARRFENSCSPLFDELPPCGSMNLMKETVHRLYLVKNERH